MRWLYKIWSGYNGFRPAKIPTRLSSGGELLLGWAKYADVAEPGDDVWVWFYEGDRFTPGIYVKGIVESVDPVRQQLVLQTQEWSSDRPLTTPTENTALAPLLAGRSGRQVYFLPDDFRRFDACTATVIGAASCAARQCQDCTYWSNLPLINPVHVYPPTLLNRKISAFAAAYWVIASRSFAYKEPARVRRGVKDTTAMFYRFKTGEAALAYPLANGIVKALAKQHQLEADAIVPIPLSPEKITAKEINRTRLLADELSRLIRVPVVDALHLSQPQGKRVAFNAGKSPRQFRAEYARTLQIDAYRLTGVNRILLLDDVCTYGNTFAAAVTALRRAGLTAEVVVTSAGQMTVRDAVADETSILKPLISR